MLVLKPFALAIFWIAACFWRDEGKPRCVWLWCALPLLLVASALAKPNLLIIFLPGLTLFLLLRRLAGKIVDWRLYLLGVLAPAVLILLWQFWVTYSAEQLSGIYSGKSGIVLAPFKVMTYRSDWLLLKFLLSMAFPLTVAIVMWRSIRREPQLVLAWLIFAVGAFQTYFLMESGPRAMHGNFCWSSQVGLLLLFVASSNHLFTSQENGREGLRSSVWFLCFTVFVLHILSGFAFYAVEYFSPEKFW